MRQIIESIHKGIEKYAQLKAGPSDWSKPPNPKLGDLCIPCFKWSKEQKKSPAALAKELSEVLQKEEITYVQQLTHAGPYLNIKINSLKLFQHLEDNYKNAKDFGSSTTGQDKNLIVEFSSPNVAKEVALHHMRSTAIGNSIAKIAKLHGYNVTRLNFLGDWGTSFGKYLRAMEIFGDETKLKDEGLSYMLKIYVEFNKQAKDKPELNEEARSCFQKLENGDPEYRRLFQLFRDISVSEFKKLYSRLGVEFDYFDGEAMYENALLETIERVSNKIGTRKSDGALVCDLEGHELPVLLQKDDGASLYMTRDLAAIFDRKKRFAFDQAWYVVATQQKLHFRQLFDLATALDSTLKGKLEHISFGMLSFGDKTMKSREGNVIFLRDVLEEGKKRALAIIQEKNPDLANAEEVAEQIGKGALIFSDLAQNRSKDLRFEWQKALAFDGDTAPFIQYTYARLKSLCKKAQAHCDQLSDKKLEAPMNSESWHQLLLALAYFDCDSYRALENKDPSQIATSLINVAKACNRFYHQHRLLEVDNKEELRIYINSAQMAASLLKQGLALLGIEAPEQM